MGRNHQAVAHTQIAGLLFIGELQPRTAAQHHHPFPFVLLVPEACGTAGQAGMNPLQSELPAFHQHLHLLSAWMGAFTAEQVGLIRCG